MAYNDVAALADDGAFSRRVAACYATETPDTDAADPLAWALAHRWDVAAQPGFGDAYASAIAGGVPEPGTDPAVISDAMILGAVQAIGVP